MKYVCSATTKIALIVSPSRVLQGISLYLVLLFFQGFGGLASAEDDTPPGWKEFVEPVISTSDVGIIVFPSRVVGGEVVEIINPAGVQLHLTNPRNPVEELVLPSGQYVIPPSGRWRVWLEDGSSISSVARLATFSGQRRGKSPPHLLPLDPGGRVTLPDGIETPSNSKLSVLVAEPPPYGGPNEVLRIKSVEDVGSGILMPARSVVASLWSSDDEQLLALSPPFAVRPGATTPAPLTKPAVEESFLAAYVERAPGSSQGSLADVSLEVSQSEVVVPADVSVPTEWGVYGYWYSLAPGTAILAGGNASTYVEPQAVELAGGEIAHWEGPILDRPLLEVTMVLPSRLREEPLHLEVWRLPEEIELASAELARSTSRHRFHRELMAGTLEVRLRTHLGVFRRRVELLPGEEGFVGLEPELIEVFGEVSLEDEPHAATLRFQTVSGDDVEAVADESGRYEAVALMPLRWLSVELTDSPHVPWIDTFMPPIRRSQELDVEIPDAEVVVRVLDATTRRPIPDAVVAVKNEYFDSDDEGRGPEWGDRSTERGRRRGRMLARTYRADEEGRARLAPPRPGRLEIFPSAPGYQESRDAAQVLEIADPPQDRETEVLLSPIGETVKLTLVLPDGSPASGAEAMLVDSLWEGKMLFHGRVDEVGVVEIPSEHAQGALLLKHPGAAGGIVDWREWSAKEEARWQFAAAAEIALTLEVTDPTGEEPARGARVALLLDGRRISGMPLRRLFEGHVGTDSNGHWTASRLPRSGVRVLAWETNADEEATAGALDNFARNVEYPWPSTVEVRVVR